MDNWMKREYSENKFHSQTAFVLLFSFLCKIRIINANELAELTGYNDSHGMILGLSPLYNNYPIKVNIDDAALAEKRVSVLMGDKVEPRKNWIEENVEFSLEDNYKI